MDGLPASRDRHVGSLPGPEVLVDGALERREVLADFLAQDRWPDSAPVAVVVDKPYAAGVSTPLQAAEDLKQRVVPAASAAERRDHHRQAQPLALGHPGQRIKQRRRPVAPDAGRYVIDLT